MLDLEKRKLISRLHRLEGQVKALEKAIEGDKMVAINQMKAVIAAAKGCLLTYGEIALQDASIETRQKILKQIVRWQKLQSLTISHLGGAGGESYILLEKRRK